MTTPLSLRFGLPVLVLLMLAGCGFHLRGSGGNTSFAQKIYLDGPGSHTAFGSVFVNALTAVGGKQVFEKAESTGIVYLYNATLRRQSITLSNTGTATGFDLSYRISYDVRNPKGEVLRTRKEFEVKRDYYNDQTLPLAQQAEEGQINEALGIEAAQSLLRRVVNDLARPPVAAPPPAAEPAPGTEPATTPATKS